MGRGGADEENGPGNDAAAADADGTPDVPVSLPSRCAPQSSFTHVINAVYLLQGNEGGGEAGQPAVMSSEADPKVSVSFQCSKPKHLKQSSKEYFLLQDLLAFVNKVYREDVGCDGVVGGMVGTLTIHSVQLIMAEALKFFRDKKFHFVDVGCDAGRVLFLALVLGAHSAEGVECRGADLGSRREGSAVRESGTKVFFGYASKIILQHSWFSKYQGRVSARFGISAHEDSTIFSGHMGDAIFAFFFAEGWAENELRMTYMRAATARKVRLLGCVPHRGAGNKLRTADQILAVLGEGWYLFWTGQVAQSGCKISKIKTFFLFARISTENS